MKLEDTSYDPQRFPGLVYHSNNPKYAMLVFKTGKMVCTGANSPKEAKEAVYNIMEKIKEAGLNLSEEPEIDISNIVFPGEFPHKIDLEAAADLNGLKRAMYEPEQFPGLILRMNDPKVVVLLFASGKLVCVGAKKEEDGYRALDKLHEELEKKNLYY